MRSKKAGMGGLVLTVWIAPAAFKGPFLLSNRVKKAKARQRWVVRSSVKGGFAVWKSKTAKTKATGPDKHTGLCRFVVKPWISAKYEDLDYFCWSFQWILKGFGVLGGWRERFFSKFVLGSIDLLNSGQGNAQNSARIRQNPEICWKSNYQEIQNSAEI